MFNGQKAAKQPKEGHKTKKTQNNHSDTNWPQRDAKKRLQKNVKQPRRETKRPERDNRDYKVMQLTTKRPKTTTNSCKMTSATKKRCSYRRGRGPPTHQCPGAHCLIVCI